MDKILLLSESAIVKVKGFIELDRTAGESSDALRIGVRGGGCSGFQYSLELIDSKNAKPEWTEEDHDGLRVFVDPMSAMYLEGVTLDYIESLDGSGFKFNNPNVKTTCGCGSSFG
jgi:iron-sulfur cluster assembly accessory protein